MWNTVSLVIRDLDGQAHKTVCPVETLPRFLSCPGFIDRDPLHLYAWLAELYQHTADLCRQVRAKVVWAPQGAGLVFVDYLTERIWSHQDFCVPSFLLVREGAFPGDYLELYNTGKIVGYLEDNSRFTHLPPAITSGRDFLQWLQAPPCAPLELVLDLAPWQLEDYTGAPDEAMHTDLVKAGLVLSQADDDAWMAWEVQDRRLEGGDR